MLIDENNTSVDNHFSAKSATIGKAVFHLNVSNDKTYAHSSMRNEKFQLCFLNVSCSCLLVSSLLGYKANFV